MGDVARRATLKANANDLGPHMLEFKRDPILSFNKARQGKELTIVSFSNSQIRGLDKQTVYECCKCLFGRTVVSLDLILDVRVWHFASVKAMLDQAEGL